MANKIYCCVCGLSHHPPGCSREENFEFDRLFGLRLDAARLSILDKKE